MRRIHDGSMAAAIGVAVLAEPFRSLLGVVPNANWAYKLDYDGIEQLPDVCWLVKDALGSFVGRQG